MSHRLCPVSRLVLQENTPPTQAEKVGLSALFSAALRFDPQDLFKCALQLLLNVLVFVALVEFAEKTASCLESVLTERQRRQTEVLSPCQGARWPEGFGSDSPSSRHDL